MNKRKPEREKADKRSISGPAELLQKVDERWKRLGYTSLSHYVQSLLRADVYGTTPHVMEPINDPVKKGDSDSKSQSEPKLTKRSNTESEPPEKQAFPDQSQTGQKGRRRN